MKNASSLCSGFIIFLLSYFLIPCQVQAARNVTIGSAATSGGSFTGGTFTPTADNANVSATDINNLLNAGTSVTIGTGSTGTQAGNITVSAAINETVASGGSLVLTANGAIGVNATISLKEGDMNFIAGGAVTQTAAISVNLFTGFSVGSNDITLNNPGNQFGQIDIFSAYNVALTATGTVNLNYAAVSDNLTVTTGGGSIIQNSTVTIHGIAEFDVGLGNITLTNTGNAFDIVAILSANNATLAGTGALILGPSVISGNLTVTMMFGPITQDGPLSVSGTSTFASTGGNDITLSDPANAFSTVSITNGNLVTINNAGDLALGPVGVGGNLAITTSGGLSFSGPMQVHGNLAVTASGPITQLDSLVIGGTSTFAAGSLNDIILANGNVFVGTVSITSGNTVVVGNEFPLHLGTVVSASLVVPESQPIDQTGPLMVGGLTLNAGSAGSILLNNPANEIAGIRIISANNVTIADTGALYLDGLHVSGNLTVTTSGEIDQDDVISVGGISIFAAGSPNDITLNDPNNDFATVSIGSGNNTVISDTNAINLGASTVSGYLTVNALGTVTQSGSIQAGGTIGLFGSSVALGGNMAAVGIIDLQSAVNLAADTFLTGNSVLLYGPLTGSGHSLTITGPTTLYGTTMDAGNSRFVFQNSFTVGESILSIQDWNGSLTGGGASQIFAGSSASDLPAPQLSKVRFNNPAGFAAGTYRGTILNTGELVPAPHPTLQFVRNGSDFILTWADTSVLQSSTNIAGPYADVPSASSPYTNLVTSAPTRFFRLR